MFFPVQLRTGNVTFDSGTNRINVIVSRQELSSFGIALQFGSFELPAKLTNFSAGVRYYQTPLLHRPGGRIVVNTTFLFDRIERLQSRPLLGALVSRVLQKYDIDLDDFSGLTENMQGTDLLPPTFSLATIQTLWTQANIAPETGVSTTIFPLIPQLFSDLRVNALSFISKDYEQLKNPQKQVSLSFNRV